MHLWSIVIGHWLQVLFVCSDRVLLACWLLRLKSTPWISDQLVILLIQLKPEGIVRIYLVSLWLWLSKSLLFLSQNLLIMKVDVNLCFCSPGWNLFYTLYRGWRIQVLTMWDRLVPSYFNWLFIRVGNNSRLGQLTKVQLLCGSQLVFYCPSPCIGSLIPSAKEPKQIALFPKDLIQQLLLPLERYLKRLLVKVHIDESLIGLVPLVLTADRGVVLEDGVLSRFEVEGHVRAVVQMVVILSRTFFGTHSKVLVHTLRVLLWVMWLLIVLDVYRLARVPSFRSLIGLSIPLKLCLGWLVSWDRICQSKRLALLFGNLLLRVCIL